MRTDREPIEIHGLCCKACGASKDNVFMMLCPTCEAATIKAYPKDFFLPVEAAKVDLPVAELELLEAYDYAEAA